MTTLNLTYEETSVTRGPVGDTVTVNNDAFTVAADAMWDFRHESSNPYTHTMKLVREPSYTGGQAGWVNSALYIKTNTPSSIDSYEWALTAVMNNNSTTGEQVAGYHQGNKLVDGRTWATVSELSDHTTNPTSGAVCHELGMWANGTDNNGMRVIADYVIGKRDSGGNSPEIQHFTRSINAFDDIANGSVKIAHYTKSNITDTLYKSHNTYELGGAANSKLTLVDFKQDVGSNNSSLKIDHNRSAAGSDWQTSDLRIYRVVDGTRMGEVFMRGKASFGRSVGFAVDGVDYVESDYTRAATIFKKPIVAAPAALATNATTGFMYIPSCSGIPTGTPATQTGTVPVVYDTTNNRFYAYNSGWKKVAMA